MSFRPFISVVIPTYNRGQQVIAAIESVLAQTYPDREIIVIDDGSTDGSGEAIQQFLNQKPETSGQKQQNRYFRQPNQGCCFARNAGIEKAQGEYIAFLDSDDTWLPEKLEWQVRAVEKFRNSCGACFTDTWIAENSRTDSAFRMWGRHYDQPMGIERSAEMLLAKSFCGFWMSTLLVRTDLIRQVGGLDPLILFAEDRDLYFRLSRITGLAYVNKELARVDRLSRPNDSEVRPWDKLDVRLRGEERMFEKWLRTDTSMPPELHKAVTRSLRNNFSLWANWYLENKRYDEARQAVSNALKYEPTLGLMAKRILTWLAPALTRRMTAKSKPYIA